MSQSPPPPELVSGQAPALRGDASGDGPALHGGASRLAGLLLAPRAHVWLTLAALLLCAPALGSGMMMDDHVLRVLARGQDGLAGTPAHPLFLFSFTDGDPAHNRALMDRGALLPWYGDPLHLNAFLRPLASLTHLLDFALAPDAAWLMHLHSLLWFAVLLLVVAHVYRALASSGLAVAIGDTTPALGGGAPVLAFALFALDDAHGMTVAWIANRNALIAAALSLPAVSAHHRWLAQGWRPGAWLGPLCFALGLCAGETAVAVLGYLFAYTVALDRGSIARRALHVLPYLALLALWRALFDSLGLGSFGSGAYHEPGREPLGYALALVQHLPVLLSAQLGLSLADNWFWGPPELQLWLWLFSALCALGFAAIGHVLLARDREARFWMIGMVLSACAVAASFPSERLLLVPGIGGAAVLAKLLFALRPLAQRWARVLLVALVCLHLIAAPLGLLGRVLAMDVLRSALDRAEASLPSTPDIAQRTVVVLNAPFDLMCSYVQPSRQARGVPRPAHLHWLAPASSALALRVLDAHTLSMRPERGFLLSEPERHYRGDPSALAAGTKVALSELEVTIDEVDSDQRPALASYRFREPLSSPRYLFVMYQDGRFVPWQPPPPGTSAAFPRADFFATMLDEGLRILAGR